VEDGDEEELEEAEIERFLDPLDFSSDADSTVVSAGPSATIDAASTGLKSTANKVEKDHDKDLAAAKPKGKTRRASTAASASSGNTIKAKSADLGGDDKAAAKGGSEKDRRASAQYPIGTEVSKDFGGVGKFIRQSEQIFSMYLPLDLSCRVHDLFIHSSHAKVIPTLSIMAQPIEVKLSRMMIPLVFTGSDIPMVTRRIWIPRK